MPSYRDWKRRLAHEAESGRSPLSMECELTSGCNFRCSMCYAREDHPQNELSTSEWKAVFDAAVQAGVLFFVLTGGEPLSRPDFWELYDHLSKKGVRISVFTNGSLLDEIAVDRFRQNPPELIAMTLYGWDSESVALVTGGKTAFSRVDRGIGLLRQAGLPFALRTLPIRPLFAGLDRLIEYVRSKDSFLGYQLYLAPAKNESGLSRLRLLPSELARFEYDITHAFSEYEETDCAGDTRDFRCQALRTGCFLSHDGFLRPCALAGEPQSQLDPSRFLAMYRSLADQWNLAWKGRPCGECEWRSLCLECPARRRWEGKSRGCVDYLEACAKSRGGRSDGNL